MITLQRRGLVDEYKGYQFRRESMAQDSAGKLIYPHNARFESGPFGDKAVMVEEGTTNLAPVPYPRAIANLAVATAIISTTNGIYFGDNTVLRRAYELYAFTGGVAYTLTVLIKMDDLSKPNAGGTSAPYDFSLVIGNDPITTNIVVKHVGEDIYSCSATRTTEITNNSFGIIKYTAQSPKGFTVIALQLEAKPYATTFTPSVRADESLTVPIEGLLSPTQGTVEMWVNVPTSISAEGVCVWSTGTGSNRFDFWVLPTISGIYYVASDWLSLGSSSLLMDGKWHIIAVTFNSVGVSIYLDGVLKNSNSIPIPFDNLGKLLKVGFYGSSNYGNYSNSLYSHLRLSSIARTAEQLAPLDGPPPVDEWTTLYLPFGGADGTRKAKVMEF